MVRSVNVADPLEAKRKEIGIPVAELARRTGINYDVLIRALKGKTMLKGDQLLLLCEELGLDFSAFDV